MTELDLVFHARRAVTAEGEIACTVGVAGGRIVAVEPFDADLSGGRVVELGRDAVLLPGLVDTHVHVNDPGRQEWEGFATATRAAAAGGITTIIDMPLNSLPPTVDPASLGTKRAAADGAVYVDVGFWGGAIPGKLDQLAGLHEAGVFGVKCFTVDSGVEEFPPLDGAGLAEAFRIAAELETPLLVHAEDHGEIEQAPAAQGDRYADFLRSRPAAAEDRAIARVVELAASTGARTHILHLASAGALGTIAEARRAGAPLTVETCPHYLSFTAEEIPDGATQFKCCPPIREAANRELLWRALAGGVIDSVVSDHSPCTAELKCFATGDFGKAWGGIASLQLGLPAVWTQARQRGFGLPDVVRWMAEGPARQVGLRHKGRIAPGLDADLCVFAPDEAFLVDATTLHHRNPVSAYHGRPLSGVVRGTWLRGVEVTGEQPHGDLLRRTKH